MGLIEEEHELWLVYVADLRQLVIESRQHPQHERAEQVGFVLDILQLENAYQSSSVTLYLHQILQVELRLAEEFLGSLLLELYHLPKQHANGLLGHSTVALELRGAVGGEILEHRAQIGKIQKQETFVVAVLEDQRKNTRLRFVETQDPSEQQRPERRDRRPQLCSLRAGEAQELNGKIRWLPVVSRLFRSCGDAIVRRSIRAE